MKSRDKKPKNSDHVGDTVDVGETDLTDELDVTEVGDDRTQASAPSDPLDGSDALAQALEELNAVKDRHLRLAAEYENFRKRTAKERTEMWAKAQASIVANLLDAMDDLDRVSELDPDVTNAADIIKGVELVERKFVRELETAGLEKVGTAGEPFDPNLHEAVGSVPAETEAADHTIGVVLQVGYRFGGTLIRPARVQVCMWQGGDGS